MGNTFIYFITKLILQSHIFTNAAGTASSAKSLSAGYSRDEWFVHSLVNLPKLGFYEKPLFPM